MKVIVAVVVSLLYIIHSALYWPEEAIISKFLSFLQLFLYISMPSKDCHALTTATAFSLMASAHIPCTSCTNRVLSTTTSHSASYRNRHGGKEDEPVLLAHAQGFSRTHRVVILQAK
jgi:hypothetical protein